MKVEGLGEGTDENVKYTPQRLIYKKGGG